MKLARIAAFVALSLVLAPYVIAADLQLEPRPSDPPNVNGTLSSALAARGNAAVIVTFWASWCEPCRDEMPSLQRLASRWSGRELSVLTVDVADVDDDATEFLWDNGVSLPTFQDTDQKIARAWAVQSIPTTIVLDKHHRIVARGRGAIDWDSKRIDQKLHKLLD